MNASGGFTLEDYRRFCAVALELGFAFRTFDQPPGPGATVHLRHDVDNLPRAVLPLAELESKLGITSTYFFMLRHENYNLLADEASWVVRRVVELGHRLGLHVVLSGRQVEADGGLAEAIQADAQLVGRIGGAPVEVFSIHNPGLVEDMAIEVPGLVNAYSGPFFEDIDYLSESHLHWRHGLPEDVLAAGGPVPYQILVHPYSYVEDLRDDRQLLLRFLADRVADLLVVNQDHHPTLGPDPIDLVEVGHSFVSGGGRR
jgi:hypothetical protein